MTQDESVTGRFVAAVGDILTHNLTADHVERWFLSLGSPHLCRDGRVRPEVKATTYNFYYARLKAFVHYLRSPRHDAAGSHGAHPTSEGGSTAKTTADG